MIILTPEVAFSILITAILAIALGTLLGRQAILVLAINLFLLAGYCLYFLSLQESDDYGWIAVVALISALGGFALGTLGILDNMDRLITRSNAKE